MAGGTLAALFFVVLLVTKLPVLSLPYHWDEAGAYVSRALWLAGEGLHHALPGLHPPASFYGHPPGVYLGLAALYRAFGHALWLTHVVAIGLAAASLFLTFRLGELLGGARVGAMAALALLLDPLFFAQSGLMHGDMTVTALGLACVVLYLRGRTRAYLVTAAALLACKETGLAIVAGVTAHHLLLRRDRPNRVREAWVLAAPSLVLGAFFAANLLTSGRAFDNPYFDERALLDPSFEHLRYVTRWLFRNQGRWILTLSIVAALIAVPRRYGRRELALLGLLVLPFWCAFTVLYVLPRYLLPAFPFVAVAAALALDALGRRWTFLPGTALAGLALTFAVGLTGDSDRPGSHEANLEYVDVVKTHRDVARWLESHHADAEISAQWPLTLALGDPAMGYVARPLGVTPEIDGADVVAWTAQGARANREVLARARAENWQLLERFEHHGKVAAVFAPRPRDRSRTERP